MEIVLIRHTSVDVPQGTCYGQTDVPVKATFEQEAAATKAHLQTFEPFDKVFCSPLTRCVKLATYCGYADAQRDDRIKEINMGDWERKKFRPGEREVDEHEIKMFFTDPFHFAGCPNGENTAQVCERTQSFLKELIKRDDDKTYLVTTHGFALRGMLNFLYEDRSDYWHGHVPYNCAVNIIEANHGVGKLIADDKIYYDLGDAVDQYAKF